LVPELTQESHLPPYSLGDSLPGQCPGASDVERPVECSDDRDVSMVEALPRNGATGGYRYSTYIKAGSLTLRKGFWSTIRV
jgi:hypothetical protein